MIVFPAPTLTTQRLTLRARAPGDSVEAMLDLCMYEGRPARDLPDAKAMLAQNEVDSRAGRTIHWLIFRGDTLLGICGYYRGYSEGVGEIGYVLRETHRGQGFMSEAIQAVLDFGRVGLNLHEVFADTMPDNTPSVTMLDRLGFVPAAMASGGYRRFRKPFGEDSQEARSDKA